MGPASVFCPLGNAVTPVRFLAGVPCSQRKAAKITLTEGWAESME